MIKVDRKLEHALIVLSHLSKSNRDKLYTAKELASIYNIAFDSVSRVMQRMSNKNFLVSIQGPSGGYKLSNELKNKTLLDLLNAIARKPIQIAKCIDGNCEKKNVCNILNPIENLNNKLTEFYSSINLTELLYLKV